jgi:hypothetical protein
VLNEILAYSNILVSEDTLNSLVTMPGFVFTNLDKIETRRLIQDKLGLPHSKTQARGVYIFTCIETNEKYVGSSTQLALRLRGYLNQTHKSSGKLIPLIKAKSLASFKLEVICLPDYSELRPEIVLEQYFLLDPEWVVGFTEAEGCFMIKISKSSAYKLGVQTQLKFQITQSSRDILLISKLVSYLGCGIVEVTKEGQVAVFVVTKFTDICEIILPFFDKHSLKGFKSSNYTSFKQGVDIFRKKEHLTASGLGSLIKIKESMNSGGLVLDKKVSSVYAYGSTNKMKGFLDKRCYSTLPINKHTEKPSLYRKNEEVSNTKETTLSLDTSQKKGSVKALSINSIYVYNRDKSILYYFTNNRQQFFHDFNIHYATFEKHFEKGTYYLGRYLFTNYLVPTSKNRQMTVSEFALKLAKDRQSKHKR